MLFLVNNVKNQINMNQTLIYSIIYIFGFLLKLGSTLLILLKKECKSYERHCEIIRIERKFSKFQALNDLTGVDLSTF